MVLRCCFFLLVACQAAPVRSPAVDPTKGAAEEVWSVPETRNPVHEMCEAGKRTGRAEITMSSARATGMVPWGVVSTDDGERAFAMRDDAFPWIEPGYFRDHDREVTGFNPECCGSDQMFSRGTSADRTELVTRLVHLPKGATYDGAPVSSETVRRSVLRLPFRSRAMEDVAVLVECLESGDLAVAAASRPRTPSDRCAANTGPVVRGWLLRRDASEPRDLGSERISEHCPAKIDSVKFDGTKMTIDIRSARATAKHEPCTRVVFGAAGGSK